MNKTISLVEEFVQENINVLNQHSVHIKESTKVIFEAPTALGLFHHHVTHYFKKSLEVLNEALSVLCYKNKRHRKSVAVSVTLTDIGSVYQYLQENVNVVLFYEQALLIFSKTSHIKRHPSLQAANRNIALLKRF